MTSADVPAVGSLVPCPWRQRPDLLAEPVREALEGWHASGAVGVVPIDPDLADTAAMSEAHDVPLSRSVNCVVVAGRRGGEERVAGCALLATTRAEVNTTVRGLLDVRKASFLPMDRAVAETGMEYGGISPVGLPPPWRLLVDEAALDVDVVVVGSGARRSKLLLPGRLLAQLPGAEVVPGLAR